MKKFTLLLLLLLPGLAVMADGNYQEAMKTAMGVLDTSKNKAGILDAANRFERIGNAEKKEWLPFYYASICYSRVAMYGESPEKIDEMLDKAQAFADQADAIDKSNSEIYTLKGLILGSRIMVDPQKRGPVYGGQANMMYAKASGFDESNPRPVYMQGISLLYTPEQFGGGREKALVVLKEAAAKYEAFKPKSDLAPDWGKEDCLEALKKAEDPNWKPW
jgi:hypothetical protein